jgi:hypothetical protein
VISPEDIEKRLDAIAGTTDFIVPELEKDMAELRRRVDAFESGTPAATPAPVVRDHHLPVYHRVRFLKDGSAKVYIDGYANRVSRDTALINAALNAFEDLKASASEAG